MFFLVKKRWVRFSLINLFQTCPKEAFFSRQFFFLKQIKQSLNEIILFSRAINNNDLLRRKIVSMVIVDVIHLRAFGTKQQEHLLLPTVIPVQTNLAWIYSIKKPTSLLWSADQVDFGLTVTTHPHPNSVVYSNSTWSRSLSISLVTNRLILCPEFILLNNLAKKEFYF